MPNRTYCSILGSLEPRRLTICDDYRTYSHLLTLDNPLIPEQKSVVLDFRRLDKAYCMTVD